MSDTGTRLQPSGVVLFIDSLGSGGAQRQIVELARGLKNRGHAVRVVMYHELYHFAPMLIENDIAYDCLRKRSAFDPLFLFDLFRYLRRHRPHALVAFLNVPGLWAKLIGRLARVPVIINSTRSTVIGDLRVWRVLERLTWRLATCAVVNAKSIKTVLQTTARVPAEHIHVIPNGVDPARFEVDLDPSEVLAMRTSLGASAGSMLVLVVGRVYAMKNHRCLIEAVIRAKLAEQFDVHLVFAGKVHDQVVRDDLGTLAESGGLAQRVHYLGQIEDVERWLKIADVSVLPSFQEGLPNAVIESMSAGKIIVASAISDNPDIITDAETGFLFPSDDADELGRVLAHVFSLTPQERDVIGQRALVAAKERYSVDAMVERFVSLFGPDKASARAQETRKD